MLQKILGLLGYHRQEAKPAEARSPKWPALEKAHLLKEPACVACGGTTHLEAHHIIPFHVDSSKELDPTNLITLCRHPSHDDHFIWGHFCDFKAWNPNVREDASEYHEKMKNRQTKRDREY